MPSPRFDRKTLVPALLGAGVCLFFQRSGIFSLFFLVPLGFLAFRYDYRVAWTALLIAVLGNALLSLGVAAAGTFPLKDSIWDFLFFSGMASVFVWFTAPPGGFGRIPGSTRFVISAFLGAVFFSAMYFWALSSPFFSEQIKVWIQSMISVYRSAGTDVVQDAMLDHLTVETVLEGVKSVMLRGGSLVSCAALFFICRQFSVVLARFFRRGRGVNSPETNPRQPGSRGAGSLIIFHVSPNTIWVLSGALLLVVLARMTRLEIPEIILWNILILCGILYLAQGLGIVQFFFARPIHPFLRFFLHVLIVVLVVSPGINALFLAGIVLLGIAENWVPFRAPKQNGTPSTPKAGDSGN